MVQFVKWGSCLLVVVILAAYANSLHGVFLLDDLPSITENPAITGQSPMEVSPRYVADLSFRLNYLWGGTRTVGYHVVNVAIHLGGTLLLFGVLRRTFRRVVEPGWIQVYSDGFALACAAIWGVHPLLSQAVNYICQRYESLMGLLFLLTFYGFIRGMDSLVHCRAWFGVSLAACFLGMGVKPMMGAAPVLLLLYDWIFTRDEQGGWKARRLLHGAYFLCLVGMALFGLLFYARGVQAGVQMMKGTLGSWDYVLTQVVAVTRYLKLTVLPTDLCLDYAPLWPAPGGVIYAGMVAYLGMIVWTLLGIKRRTPAAFGAAWFFVILAPTSSVIPVADTMFEHRMYLPLAGLVVLLLGGMGTLLFRVLPLPRFELWSRILVAVLVLSFLFLVIRRNEDYDSAVRMWADVVEKQSGNFRARNELAVAFSELGEFDKAKQAYEELLGALSTDRRKAMEEGRVQVTGLFQKHSEEYYFFVAHANMGTLLCNVKKDMAGAAGHYARALQVAPLHLGVRDQMKRVLRAQGVGEGELELEVTRQIMKAQGESF